MKKTESTNEGCSKCLKKKMEYKMERQKWGLSGSKKQNYLYTCSNPKCDNSYEKED